MTYQIYSIWSIAFYSHSKRFPHSKKCYSLKWIIGEKIVLKCPCEKQTRCKRFQVSSCGKIHMMLLIKLDCCSVCFTLWEQTLMKKIIKYVCENHDLTFAFVFDYLMNRTLKRTAFILNRNLFLTKYFSLKKKKKILPQKLWIVI